MWRHRPIDSENFNDKTKVNVAKSLQNEFTYCERVTLGHYRVDMQAVIQLGWAIGRSQYREMFRHSQFEAPEDPEGTWTFDENRQLIRRRKVPG